MYRLIFLYTEPRIIELCYHVCDLFHDYLHQENVFPFFFNFS